MANGIDIDRAFEVQADWCRRIDAPITGRVIAATHAALDRTTATGRAILDWPGDPIADALVLRIAGGLHALHRAGADAALSRLYAGEGTNPAAAAATLRAILAAHDEVLLPWLAGPPQTNEPARSAALMTGLLHLAARFGPRLELLEIGSSAGLNLLLDRYRFDLGGVSVGDDDAELTLTPAWRGPPPPAAAIKIVSVRGVDIAPIDLADPAAAARLTAYVWVEAADRQARLAAAIALAHRYGVRLDQGDAADWLEARLAEDQPPDTTRVLFHSVVWQYLPAPTRERISRAMAAAGGRATLDRRLGWVTMEPADSLSAFEIRVRGWPGATADIVGRCHPHAAWIEAAG